LRFSNTACSRLLDILPVQCPELRDWLDNESEIETVAAIAPSAVTLGPETTPPSAEAVEDERRRPAELSGQLLAYLSAACHGGRASALYLRTDARKAGSVFDGRDKWNNGASWVRSAIRSDTSLRYRRSCSPAPKSPQNVEGAAEKTVSNGSTDWIDRRLE
jgi:hypothetical protein